MTEVSTYNGQTEAASPPYNPSSTISPTWNADPKEYTKKYSHLRPRDRWELLIPQARRGQVPVEKAGSINAQNNSWLSDPDDAFPKQPFFPNRKARRGWRASGNVFLERGIILKKWEGQVTEVSATGFRAALCELGDSSAVEITDYTFSELATSDIDLVRVGAIFYWYIINHETASGRRENSSRIWFRRRGRMTYERFKDRMKELDEIWHVLGWE